ncbi:hypothetical protein HN51_067191 [Arachis hypogaea]
MEREQIREGIDEFGILYSELSDSNRSEGSNSSFAFPVACQCIICMLERVQTSNKKYSGSTRIGDGSVRRDQVGLVGQNTQLVH